MVNRSYQVIITRAARRAIYEITTYIKEEQKSPQNAQIVRKAIVEKAKSLKTQPDRFSKYDLLHSGKTGHRSVAIWDFILVYEVDEKKRRVIVDDVFHGGQNK